MATDKRETLLSRQYHIDTLTLLVNVTTWESTDSPLEIRAKTERLKLIHGQPMSNEYLQTLCALEHSLATELHIDLAAQQRTPMEWDDSLALTERLATVNRILNNCTTLNDHLTTGVL